MLAFEWLVEWSLNETNVEQLNIRQSLIIIMRLMNWRPWTRCMFLIFCAIYICIHKHTLKYTYTFLFKINLNMQSNIRTRTPTIAFYAAYTNGILFVDMC